jgi:hypothetical protein
MQPISRRVFSNRAMAFVGSLSACGWAGPSLAARVPEVPQRPVLGKVTPRAGSQIAVSPLGIGFETLDRKMFQPERTYEHLANLGVKWARVQTGWCRCETQKGHFDFAWLDEIVDSLIRIGVQPWFNLGYGNRLYTPDAPNDFAVGCVPMRTEEERQAWVRFVRAIAEHFATRVRHWEIWNEPNISGFWRPEKPSAAGYVDLVKLTAPEIRSRVPGVVLIGGAFSGGPMTSKSPYLAGCLEAGLADLVDRISYHPYTLTPETGYAAGLARWREMIAHRNPKVALWQAECGCPSTETGCGALSRYHWNESRQARWLVRRTLNDLRHKLEHISWYNVADQVNYALGFGKPKTTPTSLGEGTKATDRAGAYFGLLRAPDYSPKPSYFAYQTLCALFDSQTEMAEIPTQFAGDFAGSEPAITVDQIEQAAFVRAQSPLVAYWFPGDVQKDMPARPVDITLTVEAGLKLREPVLVDPLSGEVLKLEGKQSGSQWRFPSLPLNDYPMLVTDKAVVS